MCKIRSEIPGCSTESSDLIKNMFGKINIYNIHRWFLKEKETFFQFLEVNTQGGKNLGLPWKLKELKSILTIEYF